MSNYFLKTAQFILLAAAVIGVGANADTMKSEHMESTKTETMKGLTFNGYAEGGYAYSWNSIGKDSEFLLDNVDIRMGLDVTDHTSVVVDSAFGIRPPVSGTDGTIPGIGAVGGLFNSSRYYAKSFLSNTSGNFAYAINEAYVANKWTDGFTMWVGQYKTPFGMESKVNRYDMPTYYYSRAYNNAQLFNMFYDLGVKLDFSSDTYGHLELSVSDGKSVLTPNAASNTYSPAVSGRYSYEYKNGDMSFTPVISAYLGEWSGGPQDVALSGGLAYKMGVFNANAEFVYTAMSSDPISDIQDSKVWSVYVEPGFDLGMIQVNVKGEYNNTTAGGAGATAVGDFNIGASIGHTYMEKYRIRLAYQHLNLQGNNEGHINDLRLLFGTKF